MQNVYVLQTEGILNIMDTLTEEFWSSEFPLVLYYERLIAAKD
jgi:hypothetical protein